MRNKPTYNEQMQMDVKEYRTSGQPWPATAATIARWMIKTGRWKQHGAALVRLCARDIAKAMRDEYYTDPQGRRVRLNHAARMKGRGADETGMLWDDIRTAPRKFMEIAFGQRRLQIVGDCKQLSTDVDSYNENGPKGPELRMLWDFTDEIQVHRYDPTAIDPAIAAIVSSPPSSQSQTASVEKV